jgi:predicted nucleic acid-binding protein
LRDPDDGRHARASEELERLGASRLAVAVPYPVLLEAYSLVMRKLGLAEALAFLSHVEAAYPTLVAERPDHEEASRSVRRYPDQDIMMVDAVVSAMAARLSVPVWTHDHHFDTLGTEVWR